MSHRKKHSLQRLLDDKYIQYAEPSFIPDDPISIPHSYDQKEDREITAFWVSMLSWGNRTTIINKSKELFDLMDNAPYDFIVNHEEKDRERFLAFKHRTFQSIDTLYFLAFLQHHFQEHKSLEPLFLDHKGRLSIANFHNHFFSLPYAPKRTRKHVATTERGSTCKRINMFLRWMVRPSDNGVDFGQWETISTKDLRIPLDIHVYRVALHYGLLERKIRDWKAVEELTNNLKKYDPIDPVRYDYALFGMGVNGEF